MLFACYTLENREIVVELTHSFYYVRSSNRLRVYDNFIVRASQEPHVCEPSLELSLVGASGIKRNSVRIRVTR